MSKLKTLTVAFLSVVLGATTIVGAAIDSYRDATPVEAASLKRLYIDPNGLSGWSWTNTRCYYYGGTSSASWPGNASTPTNKINASSYVFTGGRNTLSRTIYYFDIPSDATTCIITNSNGTDVWNRWNKFNCSQYNFFQYTGWGVNGGDENTVSNYNSYKAHNVTLNHADGSKTNEVIVSSWGQYQAPSSNWYTDSNFTTAYTTKTLTADITLYEKPTYYVSINGGSKKPLTYKLSNGVGEWYIEGETLVKDDTLVLYKGSDVVPLVAKDSVGVSFNNAVSIDSSVKVLNDAEDGGLYFDVSKATATVWVSGHTFDDKEVTNLYFGIDGDQWENGVYLYSWGSSGTNEINPNGIWPGEKLGSDATDVQFKGTLGLIRVPIYTDYTTHFLLSNGLDNTDENYYATSNFKFDGKVAYYEVTNPQDSTGDATIYGPAAAFVFELNEARLAVQATDNISQGSICGLDADYWVEQYDALSSEVQAVINNAKINTYTKDQSDDPTAKTHISFSEIIAQLRENSLNSFSSPLRAYGFAFKDSGITSTVIIILVVLITTAGVMIITKKKATKR